jgi:N utilization substance protein A
MEELDILEREKGVSKETILDALANALVSAYKRSPGAAEEARVTIDQDTGEIKVYGQELDEDGNVTREWEDTPSDFGRIGAQTAKQVILQRLRDASGPRCSTCTRAATATSSPASSSSPITAP